MDTNNETPSSNLFSSPEHTPDQTAEGNGGPAGGAGSAGTPGRTPAPPASMAESVTRHAQNPPDDVPRFLSCGIDTLDLGLYVSWDENWEKTKEYLSQKKEQSHGTTGILEATDLGRDFLHLPSGKAPNYRYHLQFLEYHVYIAISGTPKKSPNVYVSINSETLWHESMSTIRELLGIDLDFFGGIIERIQPSRCDLCADFLLTSPPSFAFLQDHRVSRSRAVRPYLDGDILESYYCGSGKSPVQLRLYDKGKEIIKSNKQWFLPIWGLESGENVWRVEFQLRRPFLRQFRINDMSDFWKHLGTVWEYLTSSWFSLRLNDNEKPERRTILPWWAEVKNCRERFGMLTDARRTFSSDSMEPIQQTLAHIIGRMMTIAAHNGTGDRTEAIQQLAMLIDKNTTDSKFRDEYLKRKIKIGYKGTLGGAEDDE